MTLKGKTILIIEDDSLMRDGLRDNLEFEGYRVVCAVDGEKGLALADAETPDLILLDVMLPGVDGIDVCRQLRSRGKNVPIIMLSARGSEIDKVIGLEIGADDYLAKPFGVQELLARIKALFRRFEPKELEGPYRFDQIEIDFSRHTVQRDNTIIELTAKEFELLKCFVHNAGVALTRESLLEKVWGMNSSTTTRTVDNHVLKLRKKLEEHPETPRYFMTIYGVGYKFIDGFVDGRAV